MSNETFDELGVSDHEGAVFDPESVRVFSILPECDDDEAYCVRHERDMPEVGAVYKHDGALYTTSAGWGIYSCPACCSEFGPKAQFMFKRCVTRAFNTFDDTSTDTLEGAFRYVGEVGEPEGGA